MKSKRSTKTTISSQTIKERQPYSTGNQKAKYPRGGFSCWLAEESLMFIAKKLQQKNISPFILNLHNYHIAVILQSPPIGGEWGTANEEVMKAYSSSLCDRQIQSDKHREEYQGNKALCAHGEMNHVFCMSTALSMSLYGPTAQ